MNKIVLRTAKRSTSVPRTAVRNAVSIAFAKSLSSNNKSSSSTTVKGASKERINTAK